ncbi:MAG: GntR family transcriptional regulator [Firmicutes bacterium]|jgi:DNA-binding GntR family transcriptional regulator|nr:GntR family transcriptional regulator [Bacillota bacterium]
MGERLIVTNEVYQQIRDKICNLQLRPNIPLVESTLAEDLNVSRTPVREALRMLEGEGLVTIIRGKGAFVSPIHLQDLEDIFVVREALEGVAARTAATKITQSALAALESAFDCAELAWAEGRKGAPVVDEIHSVVLQFGGNRLINDIFSRLQGPILRFHNCALALPRRDERSFQEHKVVFESLKARDPEAAESGMREHLRSTKESLIRSWIGDEARTTLSISRGSGVGGLFPQYGR